MSSIQDFMKRVEQVNRQWAKSNKGGSSPRVVIGSDLPTPVLVSTGNPSLDWGLNGGIPEGTIFELFGSPGCGKTTAMAYIMSEVQKKGKLIIYYHTEESRKPLKAWSLANVDESKVVYVDARNTGEDGLNVIRDLLIDESGNPISLVGMIVIDSVSAIAPSAEISSTDNNGLEGVTVGRHAAMMSKLFRIICGTGWLREGCIVGLINQERTQIGSVPLPNVTPGGKSITYYPKIRIQLKAPKDGLIYDDKKQIIGHTIEYFVHKNNTGVASPFKRGSWRVIYDEGIDYIGPIIEEAISYGVIQDLGKGRFIVRHIVNGKICSSKSLHGRQNLLSFINENNLIEFLQEIISRIRTYCSTKSVQFLDGKAYIDNQEVDMLLIVKGAEGEFSNSA